MSLPSSTRSITPSPPSSAATLTNRSLFLQLFRQDAHSTLPARTRWLSKCIADLRATPLHERAFLAPYSALVDAKVARIIAETLGEVLVAGGTDRLVTREVMMEAVVFFTQRHYREALEALAKGGFSEALDEALVAACVGGDDSAGKDRDEESESFVQWLILEKKCDVTYRDARAFHCAVRDGNAMLCQILIDAGIKVQANDDAALMLACELGRVDVVKKLADNGACLKSRDGEALRLASGNGHLDVVHYILEHAGPALVHAQCEAALRRAAGSNHVDVVKLLLSRGADPNVSEVWGHSQCALVEAAVNGHAALIRPLAQYGKVPATGQSFWLALMSVCFQGRVTREAVIGELLAVGDEMFSERWVERCAEESDKGLCEELVDAAYERELEMLIERLVAVSA